ncbi:3'-5' exonuclease [Streptomyces sp. Ag109_O5-1]|uniref:3'-5' exonuclease n=1 Tax=Streptomyces sp. Ag109_O5-1 TaxID=1938851 RepID=UPI00162896EB|nr:3'-5' exonuclease [Streptomyces sp. Ag109_O5-1]
MVDAATGEVLLETLVNPQTPVTSGALAVHGASDAMVAGAPTWDQVLPEVLRVTGGWKILACNAEYDKTVAVADCQRVGANPHHLSGRGSWGCITCKRCDWEGLRDFLPLTGGHRGLGDACTALDVMRSLVKSRGFAFSEGNSEPNRRLVQP